MSSIDQQLADILAASFYHGSSFVTSESYRRPLRTFLFGHPIAHSLAPLLHKRLFNGINLSWTYELHETEDSDEFLPCLKQHDVIGCAITMPYKVKLMSAVDQVTEEGRMIGAINTVFLRKVLDGTTCYVGTNTDCVGVREAFIHYFPDILEKSRGKPAMVIGGGGACRAAVYALWKWMGASEIYMVNRLESEVTAIQEAFRAVGFPGKLTFVSSVDQASVLETPCLIVGTVSDLPPTESGEIIARQISEHFLGRQQKGHILEMCYHPQRRTAFYILGEKAGWRMLYGTEAMIWQGVAQQVLWAERNIDDFQLKDAQDAICEATKMH